MVHNHFRVKNFGNPEHHQFPVETAILGNVQMANLHLFFRHNSQGVNNGCKEKDDVFYP